MPEELDSDRTMVLVFGGLEAEDAQNPVADLLRAFPRATVIGTSTAGGILGGEVVDDSLVVAIGQFEHSAVRGVDVAITASSSYDAGRALGSNLAGQPDLRVVLVASEGIDVNGSELVRGLVESTPTSPVITGGLAGDGDRFERTWVLSDGALQRGRAAAIGLYGPSLQVGYGSGGGWDMFGPERMITRSDRNTLFELDGRPALDLYSDYLGERADNLPASGLLFPLALRTDTTGDELIVRTILAVDRDARSLTFAGDVPTGSRAQLMTASFDRLIEGAERAAAGIAEGSVGPVLALAVSCVGRRLVLGERTEDEIEATLASLPAGTTQIGYYSYGEIAPSGLQTCELHNQTMTITALAERLAG